MKLEEVLQEFPSDALKEAVIEYQSMVHDIPRAYSFDTVVYEQYLPDGAARWSGGPATRQVLYPAYERYPEERKYFAEALQVGTKESFINLMISELNDLTSARVALHELNKSDVLIDDEKQIRPALAMSLLPKDAVEHVAVKNGVPVRKSKTGFLGSVKGKLDAKQDSERWSLISAMATFIAASEGSLVSKDSYATFCPDCAEDAPAGADHCISCGRELPLIICASCDTENLPQAKYCMSCGEKR